jgi:hypothetical protein
VTLTSRLKSFNRIELASLLFYAVSGIILLVFLPLTSFAPQLALLGILSLVVAYGVFTKRGWGPWLLFILFVAAEAFSLYTLYAVGFSNALLGISMVAYSVLTLLCAGYILLKKKSP